MSSTPLAVLELRAQTEDAHERLRRARSAVTEAQARFLDTGEEADRLACVAARAEERAALDTYWGYRETTSKVELSAARDPMPPPACSICRRRHGREVRHAAE